MPKKIPLVLVPVLAANHRMWETQINTLRDIADCRAAPLPAVDDLSAIAEEIPFLAPDRFAPGRVGPWAVICASRCSNVSRIEYRSWRS